MKENKMESSKISWLITNNSVSVSFEGRNKIILKEDSRFEEVVDCIRNQDWVKLEAALDKEKQVETYSNGRMRVVGGTVYITQDGAEFTVSHRLNTTILFYVDQKLPLDSLVNFALKLKANTSYHSTSQLFDYLDHNRFTLTNDGNFIAYKRVDNDFLDFHTHTFDNSPGKIVSMSRNNVDDNPEAHCSNGLHLGSFDFCKNSYHAGQGQLVMAEVDPKDVVSVPNDHNFQKIRVCCYRVVEVIEEEYKEPIIDFDEEDCKYEDCEGCPECDPDSI